MHCSLFGKQERCSLLWQAVSVTPPTPRQLAREETTARIKALALEQLASSSATELSLRAVAREIGVVSSAVYRYFASRDELLTALIVDAYDDLADHLERAGRPDRRGARRRWLEVCGALRAWALAQPHRFALVYGSAIPGYAAPATTIEPAGRVVRAFCLPAAAGETVPGTRGDPLTRALTGQLAVTAEALELDVDAGRTLLLVGAFAQVVGLLTLELNGHFVGGFEPADALFEALVADRADALGL